MSKQYLIEFQISFSKRKEREQILNGEKKAAPAVEKMNKIKAAGRKRQNAVMLATFNKGSSSGQFENANSASSMPRIPSASSPPRSPKATIQVTNEDELLPPSPSSKEKLSIIINPEPGQSSTSRPVSRSGQNQEENMKFSPQDLILQKLAASPYRTSSKPHSAGKSPKLRPLSQSTSSVLRLNRMVTQLEKSPLPQSTLQPPSSPTGRRPPHRSESDLQQMLHLTDIYHIPLQEIETQVSSPRPSSPKHTPNHRNNRSVSRHNKRPASASSTIASNAVSSSTLNNNNSGTVNNSRPNSAKHLVSMSLTKLTEASCDSHENANVPHNVENNQKESEKENESFRSKKEGTEEVEEHKRVVNENEDNYEEDDFYRDDFEETNNATTANSGKFNAEKKTDDMKEEYVASVKNNIESSSLPPTENDVNSKGIKVETKATETNSEKENEIEMISSFSSIQPEPITSNDNIVTDNNIDISIAVKKLPLNKNDSDQKDDINNNTNDNNNNNNSGKFDRSQVFPNSSKPATSSERVRKSSSFTTSSVSVPHYTSVASSSSSAKIACPSFYRSAKALEKDIFRLAQIEAGAITAEEWRRQQQQPSLNPPAWDSRIVTATSLLAEKEIPKLGHEHRRESIQQHLAQLKKKVEERDLKTKNKHNKTANNVSNDEDNMNLDEDTKPKSAKKYKRVSNNNRVHEEHETNNNNNKNKFDKSVKRLSFDSKRKSLETELGIAVREPLYT